MATDFKALIALGWSNCMHDSDCACSPAMMAHDDEVVFPAYDALTPAQRRYLTEVHTDGKRVYNGRARRPIKALEAAGLVDVDWDMRAQSKGNGIELVEVITVTPRSAS